MTFKFARREPEFKLDFREVRYTNRWLEYAGARVLRGILCYVGFGSGAYAAPLPTAQDMAARETFPRYVWWRGAARDGVEAAEVFANSGVRLPPRPKS